MSRTVELTDDVYARVEQRAAAAGMTVVEWIAAGAPAPCVEPFPSASENGAPKQNSGGEEATDPPTETRTLADRLAGGIGRLRSARGDFSERGSELFAEGLLEQQRTVTCDAV